MKQWLAILGLFIICSCSTDRESMSFNKTDLLIDYLNSLPDHLTVSHSPEIVKEINQGDDGWRYKWNFKTKVCNDFETEIQILYFGILGWKNMKWVLDESQEGFNSGLLSGDYFEEWYNCGGSMIRPGECFEDLNNWAGSDKTNAFKQRWFFIGIDRHGSFCKGEAEVFLEGGTFSEMAHARTF